MSGRKPTISLIHISIHCTTLSFSWMPRLRGRKIGRCRFRFIVDWPIPITHLWIQLAVGDMTMSVWKQTLSLIPPPHPPIPITTFSSAVINRCNTSWGSSGHWFTAVLPSTQTVMNMRTPERVLSVSGYTKKAWRTATRAHPWNNSSSTQPSEKVRKGSVTIPYVGQATEEIARLFHDRGVTTHICLYDTIRATMDIVRPKDKLLMEEQCGVVYQITRSPDHISRQAVEGAPAPWFPSKWPPSGTQPRLYHWGCSGETPRELG